MRIWDIRAFVVGVVHDELGVPSVDHDLVALFLRGLTKRIRPSNAIAAKGERRGERGLETEIVKLGSLINLTSELILSGIDITTLSA